MSLYRLIQPCLFRLDAETAHELTLKTLASAYPLIPKHHYDDPITLMGLTFSNRLGLAAGLDKNGIAIRGFDRLGFGHIEIGTVTPRPQAGNDKPRLFRLPEHRAIINRMGFNNHGIDALIRHASTAKPHINAILGINIGKNKTTPNENALDDYLHAMQLAYPVADYLTINISSPNTEGLRELQHGDDFKTLLTGLKEAQANLHTQHQKYTPIAVKIAPDNDENAIHTICQAIADSEIDAIIATNTTIDKTAVAEHPYGNEIGGLSGAPLTAKATAILQQIRAELPNIPLIAVGGVMNGADYRAKLAAGADLVQIYTGLIYRGPALIHECLAHSSITQ